MRRPLPSSSPIGGDDISVCHIAKGVPLAPRGRQRQHYEEALTLPSPARGEGIRGRRSAFSHRSNLKKQSQVERRLTKLHYENTVPL